MYDQMMMAITSDTVRAAFPPSAVDLFCGAGGLSFGMKQAGVAISAGIDLDPACRYPFETNVEAQFYQEDVAKLSPEFVSSLFPENSVRVLAGCAPCQPFSSYTTKASKRKKDWNLLSEFANLITAIEPEIVTMENVPRLESHGVFEEFLDALKRANYRYRHNIVRCAEYGVPQRRRRLVLLASRFGDIELVPATHSKSQFVTVQDSIQDLEEIKAGGVSESDPLHKSSGLSRRNLERIRQSKPGGTWRDWDTGLRADCHAKSTGKTYQSVYGRMRWNELAPTLTTQFHGFGNGRFGHPVQNRAISLREGALLQTFPREYSFIAKDEPVRISSIARLIGNAVPVKIGEAIGRSIIAHLEKRQ